MSEAVSVASENFQVNSDYPTGSFSSCEQEFKLFRDVTFVAAHKRHKCKRESFCFRV